MKQQPYGKIIQNLPIRRICTKRDLNKIIYRICLLLSVILGNASCSESKEQEETLMVSKVLLNVSEKEISETISITATHEWRIVCTEDWVKPSLTSGSGNRDVTFTVYSNSNKEERQTKVFVKGISKEIGIDVIQSGVALTFQVDFTQKTLEPSGEEFTVNVTSNGLQWETEVPASDRTWLSLKEKSNEKAVFVAKLNNNGQERNANLLFKEKGKTNSKTVKVTQNVFSSTVSDIAWSKLLSKVADSWFKTNEAKEVADNVLLYQRDCGGWHKNIEMHHILTDSEKAVVKADKSDKGCFDNSATTMEMRFLAKMYKEVSDNRYRDAFVKGLDYIIRAQYSSGGWPQYFPLRGGYSDFITFNDDLVVNLLKLLRDVYEGSGDFTAIVEDATKQKAKDTFDKGVKCILNCQIVDEGIKTLWCAQHDPVTLDPAVGRPHELPSFSGSEGAKILEFLMTIESPSDEVKQAVVAAVDWLNKHKIPNKRVMDVKDVFGNTIDRKVEDSAGENLWGRFIQLGGTVAERVYSNLFNNFLNSGKRDYVTAKGDPITYYYKENAEESYSPEKAYQPVYGIYDNNYAFLFYRFLYNYEDTEPVKDKNGVMINTSLRADNRRSYQYLGNWPQKILKEKYPKWKTKYGM